MQAREEGQLKRVVRPAGEAVTAEGGFSLQRLEVPAGQAVPFEAAPSGEHALYVVSGSGELVCDGERHPLGAESVAWLEPGERCELVAGDEGLAVLASSASPA